jgi:hypothetical protein
VPDRSPFVPVSLAVLALSGLARADEPAKPARGREGGDPRAPGPAPVVRDGGAPQGPAGSPDGAKPAGPAAAAVPGPAAPDAVEPPRRFVSDAIRPPPLHVEYAQFGVAILALVNLDAGAMCGKNVRPLSTQAPCILGSGGGLVIRAGYRSPGPWYIGGAYAFSKMDSSDLYRLGILQQIWGEMRYLPDTGYRVSPFATWGVGAVAYGSEWGVETGGTMIFGGGGLQAEVSRVAVIGLGFVYKPTVIAAWTDTAGYHRPAGVAQFLGFDFQLELRSETGRR